MARDRLAVPPANMIPLERVRICAGNHAYDGIAWRQVCPCGETAGTWLVQLLFRNREAPAPVPLRRVG